jgi:hypothetical protein
MARRIRSCSLWSRRHRAHTGTGHRIRLPAHLSRRHVLSCPAGTPPSLPGAHFLPRSFVVSLGVTAYAWTGRLACALCSIYLLIRGRQSTRFTSPRRYRSGGLARSRPELPMSGTNQMRPASSARMHQTKWCDLDLRFAASTEPTCSAVAGKMEAKVTASGAGLLACF